MKTRLVNVSSFNFDSDWKADLFAILDKLYIEKQLNFLTDKNSANENFRYLINKNSNEYWQWRLNKVIENKYYEFDIIVSPVNLYLQGFISKKTNTYYYFNDSVITEIECLKTEKLPYNSNYNTLIGNQELIIDQESFKNSFLTLYNFDGTNPNLIQKSIVMIIFVSCESIRFSSMRKKLLDIFRYETGPYPTLKWQSYKYLLTNWQNISRKYWNGNKNSVKKHVTVLFKDNC